MLENGVQKSVTEPYLVDALSFTEAEARITDEMLPYVSGPYLVADIKRAKYSEVFTNLEGDRYYKAKIYFLTLDEKSGNEKRTAASMLVQASDIEKAIQGIKKGMEGTLADYEIGSVSESDILDVFVYGNLRQV